MKKITSMFALFLICLGMSAVEVQKVPEISSVDVNITSVDVLVSNTKIVFHCEGSGREGYPYESASGQVLMEKGNPTIPCVWTVEKNEDNTYSFYNEQGHYMPQVPRGGNVNAVLLYEQRGKFVINPSDGGFWDIKNHNDNNRFNSNGTTFTGWDASGGNSNYSIKPVTLAEVRTPVLVNYQYYFGEKLIKELKVRSFVGAKLSAPELPFLNCAVEGLVAENTSNVKVECTEKDLPFVKSESVENATWYFMTIGDGGQWSAECNVNAGDGTSIDMYPNKVGHFVNSQNTPKSLLEDVNSQWCFIGDVVNGFKIYNRNGLQLVAMDGNYVNNDSRHAYTVKDAGQDVLSTWNIVASDIQSGTLAGKKGFMLGTRSTTNPDKMFYLNARDGGNGKIFLGFWDGFGAGSVFAVSQVLPEVSLSVIGENSYSSLYLPYAVKLTDANVKAYYGTLSEKTLTMHEINDGIIPANTGVVLKAAKDVTSAHMSIEGSNPEKMGSIEGVTVATAKDAGFKYYVLNNGADGIGFYNYTGAELGANKTFVKLAESAAVNSFRLDFGDLTGVEAVEVAQPTEKQVIFDLSGRRVSKMTKGLYIINGKKILVK